MASTPSHTSSNNSAKRICYVRVTGVLHHKFVEFDFSIDEPTLFVELVLPFDQFKHFCETHQAKELTAEQEAAVDLDRLKWRYGQPGKAIVNNQLLP